MDHLDATDIKLLKLLQENSNRTVKELASLVNLSSTPVFERMRRLENSGYIKKYMAILSHEKLNKGFIVFCQIRLKHHSLECRTQFMTVIADIDEITECYNISGEYDFMLKICAQSMSHYKDFVLNILSVEESIGSIHSLFVMEEVKQSYSVPFGAPQDRRPD
jgi:DNA-binding Lrp family transcriptional regulator